VLRLLKKILGMGMPSRSTAPAGKQSGQGAAKGNDGMRKNSFFRNCLVSSGSLTAMMICASAAHAAAAAEMAAPAAATVTTSAAAAAAAPSVTPETDEVPGIVVTAQRRQQSLQDVPLAVSAVSGDSATAMGITDVQSIQAVAPSLEFPRYFNNATPALRGVGTNAAIGAQESVVALYVDDVYIASPAATTFSFNNIEQIAVLKGPQGTLFGRNAMAGVLQITTRDPQQDTRIDAELGYANYDTVSGSLYATTGIAPNLAADIALTGSHQGDGWGKNLATGKDAFRERYWAGRSKWVLDLDRTKLTLTLDYTKNIYNAGIAMRPVKGAQFPNGQVYEGYYNIRELPEGEANTRQGGVSLKVEHDLGWAQLNNVAAWRKVKSHTIADEDQSTAYSQDVWYDDNRETFTDELHLASPDSQSDLQWIAGLFYLYDKPYLNLAVLGDAVAPLQSIEQTIHWHNESYAAFAQATWAFLPTWHLTGGVRYTYDKTRFSGVTASPADDLLIDRGGQKAHFDNFTYKAALQKDFSRDVMGYVSYSTGYKSGIFNFSDYHAAPVKPEELDALEAGLKTELFDRQLRLNITGFYYWYKNLQVSTLVESEGRTLTTLQNAASARNKGIEVEAEWVPVRHLSIHGSLAYMHSRFNDFPDATLSSPLPGGGNATYAGSAKGFETPHSPDFTSSIGADYTMELASGDLTLATNYNYNGGFAWDADNRLRQHPYHLVNASGSWAPSSGVWDVRLWVKNLLGEKYSVYTTANIVGDEETPAAPRTYGVTARVHF